MCFKVNLVDLGQIVNFGEGNIFIIGWNVKCNDCYYGDMTATSLNSSTCNCPEVGLRPVSCCHNVGDMRLICTTSRGDASFDAEEQVLIVAEEVMKVLLYSHIF